MENILQQHAILLKDTIRMEAYKKAIEETVRDGDVVVDIGCGLGILSFLALQAGAKHVHAIEAEPNTLKLAKLIAKQNGLDKKITFHKGLSFKARLRERADVVISEIFGNLGLNENVLPVMLDAKKRLLKDGGKIIPSGIKVWLAPCENKDWEYTAKAMHNMYGLDILPDMPEMDLGISSVIIKNADLLANSQVFTEIEFTKTDSPVATNELVFEIARNGTLAGFAGWFETRLTKNVSFATNPSGLTTHWKQGFLPLRTPQILKKGQRLKLTLDISPDPSGLNSIISYNFKAL